MPLFRNALLGLGFLAALSGPASAQCSDQVDVAVVLALDVSGSVKFKDWELEKNGYVQAFRDPAVIDAILRSTCGRIAVTAMQWSSILLQNQVVPWTVLDSREAISGFAARLADMERLYKQNTSIAGALRQSLELFDELPYETMRKVVNVSGNGRDDFEPDPTVSLFMPMPTVEGERDRAVDLGVTINGLSIQDKDASYDVHEYYREKVVSPDGFLIRVETFEDFASAVRRKIVLELADIPPDMRALFGMGVRGQLE